MSEEEQEDYKEAPIYLAISQQHFKKHKSLRISEDNTATLSLLPQPRRPSRLNPPCQSSTSTRRPPRRQARRPLPQSTRNWSIHHVLLFRSRLWWPPSPSQQARLRLFLISRCQLWPTWCRGRNVQRFTQLSLSLIFVLYRIILYGPTGDSKVIKASKSSIYDSSSLGFLSTTGRKESQYSERAMAKAEKRGCHCTPSHSKWIKRVSVDHWCLFPLSALRCAEGNEGGRGKTSKKKMQLAGETVDDTPGEIFFKTPNSDCLPRTEGRFP